MRTLMKRQELLRAVLLMLLRGAMLTGMEWKESMTLVLKDQGATDVEFRNSTEWRDCGCACGEICHAWGEYPMMEVNFSLDGLEMNLNNTWRDL